MKESWSSIWKKKSSLPFSNNYKTLLSMNGWDTGVSSFSINDWKKFINLIIKKFKIKKGDKVFEIGCGSGAFLLPFYKKKITCYGLDYSSKFIKTCNKIMKKGVFIKAEANDLKKFKRYKFNYIFIHSVFQYFDSMYYANQVMGQLKKISQKGTKVFILDVPNLKKKKTWEQKMIKSIGKKEFDKKYSNLNHLFYPKSFFEKFCKRNNFSLEIISKIKLKKQSSQYRLNYMIKV